jgi:hypothetical protein
LVTHRHAAGAIHVGVERLRTDGGVLSAGIIRVRTDSREQRMVTDRGIIVPTVTEIECKGASGGVSLAELAGVKSIDTGGRVEITVLV